MVHVSLVTSSLHPLSHPALFLKEATTQTGEGPSHSAAHWRIHEATSRMETFGAGTNGGWEQTHHGVCEPTGADGGGQKGENQGERSSKGEPLQNSWDTFFRKTKHALAPSLAKVAYQTICTMTLCIAHFSCRGSSKRKGSGVKSWSECVRIFILRKRSRPRGRERLWVRL